MIAGLPDKKRGVERLAGTVALLISFLVVAGIFTSLDIHPEFVNIHEDLSYLGENMTRIRLNTWIWFVNSILILMLGPLLLMSFLPYGRSSAYLAAFLISTTGILYINFSINGHDLIFLVTDYLKSAGEETDIMAGIAYKIMVSKTNLQLAAYTLAGLSSMILGLLIASTGHLPRFIGWLAIFGGLIYASFGWISTDHILFTIGRLLFIIALVLLGSFLLLRGLVRKEKKA
jgi:MFS family permease